MNFNKKFYNEDDVVENGGGTTQETPEEKAARLEAELNAEREKIKNQNSYITKLEAERNATKNQAQPQAQPKVQTQSQPQAQTVSRDPYLVELQTKDVISNGLEAVKAQYGEEVFNEIKDDVVRIARANIKDPSAVPAELFERVAEMAIGRAMKDEDKRIKIAGAYVKAPESTPPVKETVIVTSPNGQKIGTMTPDDKKVLGQQTVPPGGQLEKKRSPKEFMADFRNRK